jgi:hypothetical protein
LGREPFVGYLPIEDADRDGSRREHAGDTKKWRVNMDQAEIEQLIESLLDGELNQRPMLPGIEEPATEKTPEEE